jgi:hypothetical protein
MASVSQIARWLRQADREANAEKKVKRKIYRVGKTRRDRNAGRQLQNEENKMLRREYQKDTSSRKTFPWHTCNGKKNRHQYTGKGGKQILVERKGA